MNENMSQTQQIMSVNFFERKALRNDMIELLCAHIISNDSREA